MQRSVRIIHDYCLKSPKEQNPVLAIMVNFKWNISTISLGAAEQLFGGRLVLKFIFRSYFFALCASICIDSFKNSSIGLAVAKTERTLRSSSVACRGQRETGHIVDLVPNYERFW